MTPSKSVISSIPATLVGTEVLGSGNWEIPCWRMHCAILTSLARVCAEGCVVEPGPGGPPPGRSFWHFARAALNAGDEGLIPAPTGKRNPPPGFGSGKLGTPLERMHLANASPRPAPGAVGPGLVVVRAGCSARLGGGGRVRRTRRGWCSRRRPGPRSGCLSFPRTRPPGPRSRVLRR